MIRNWRGSVVGKETTLHQLSPYIGKVKSSMAASLISQFTSEGMTVYDPFAGSGTIPLEAWISGRNPIANDLNPYAFLLSTAKLFPYSCLRDALGDIEILSDRAESATTKVDLRTVPRWVRAFFNGRTLRELIAWIHVLKRSRRYFLLACLLGILHHQRPGFLSFPSSHTVPYLRSKRFPPGEYPQLYEYREVRSRLEAKVTRALSRIPTLNFKIPRVASIGDCSKFVTHKKVEAIITSPPYMRSLDYARDNRLRLWFLGASDWRTLERRVSPTENSFILLMRRCLTVWRQVLSAEGCCIIVSGDRFSRTYGATIPDVIAEIAINEVGGYELIEKYRDKIPDSRRVRRGMSGNLHETILVLKLSNRTAKK
jgi:hypothetical protein